jgi:hypothetical protein
MMYSWLGEVPYQPFVQANHFYKEMIMIVFMLLLVPLITITIILLAIGFVVSIFQGMTGND